LKGGVAVVKEEKRQFRVVTFLTREELDFLDEITKDIFFSKGINIPRTKLIEELINAFRGKDDSDTKAIEDMLIERLKK